MKKAILYLRVDKNGLANPTEKLEEQEKELREYCTNYEIEIIKVIAEVASGKDFNRPEFTSLHLAIRKREIQADLLLFTSIDVFSENLADVLRMHHALLRFGITTKAVRDIEVVFIRTKEE